MTYAVLVKIQRYGSFILDSLVFEHNDLYLLLSKGILNPKFHYVYIHMIGYKFPFVK